jgi:hypothetical protein
LALYQDSFKLLSKIFQLYVVQLAEKNSQVTDFIKFYSYIDSENIKIDLLGKILNKDENHLDQWI